MTDNKLYRCSVCKSTNCIKILNTNKPPENKSMILDKCECFKCKMITDIEYIPDTKIHSFKEPNPFNNFPNNFNNE